MSRAQAYRGMAKPAYLFDARGIFDVADMTHIGYAQSFCFFFFITLEPRVQ